MRKELKVYKETKDKSGSVPAQGPYFRKSTLRPKKAPTKVVKRNSTRFQMSLAASRPRKKTATHSSTVKENILLGLAGELLASSVRHGDQLASAARRRTLPAYCTHRPGVSYGSSGRGGAPKDRTEVMSYVAVGSFFSCGGSPRLLCWRYLHVRSTYHL